MACCKRENFLRSICPRNFYLSTFLALDSISRRLLTWDLRRHKQKWALHMSSVSLDVILSLPSRCIIMRWPLSRAKLMLKWPSANGFSVDTRAFLRRTKGWHSFMLSERRRAVSRLQNLQWAISTRLVFMFQLTTSLRDPGTKRLLSTETKMLQPESTALHGPRPCPGMIMTKSQWQKSNRNMDQ